MSDGDDYDHCVTNTSDISPGSNTGTAPWFFFFFFYAFLKGVCTYERSTTEDTETTGSNHTHSRCCIAHVIHLVARDFRALKDRAFTGHTAIWGVIEMAKENGWCDEIRRSLGFSPVYETSTTPHNAQNGEFPANSLLPLATGSLLSHTLGWQTLTRAYGS